jgi:hypothetical protein
MLRQSTALLSRTSSSALLNHVVPSRKIKSGVLKPLHLGLVKWEHKGFQALKDQDAVRAGTEESMKRQQKNVGHGKQKRHQYQSRHHHGAQALSGQPHGQGQYASKAVDGTKLVKNISYKDSQGGNNRSSGLDTIDTAIERKDPFVVSSRPLF